MTYENGGARESRLNWVLVSGCGDGHTFIFQLGNYLGKYIFLFHCLQLKKIGHVPTCTRRQGDANLLLLFTMHQYICAANHLAPIY
jgi:hypothetical protein